MRKTIALFLASLFLLFSNKVIAQADSLIQLLATTSNDSLRIELLGEISYKYIYADRDKAQAYADTLMLLSKELNHQEGILYSRYISATLQHYQGNLEEALTNCIEVLADARQSGNRAIQAKVLNMICLTYMGQQKLDKALEAIQESLEICRELGDKAREAIAYYTTASLYQYQNENEISKTYLKKAAVLFEELNDTYRLGIVYQGLAVLSKPAEALSYAKKALEILENTHDLQGRGMALWSIGDAYYEMRENKKALEYYQQARNIFTEIDYPEGLANINSNIGIVLSKIGYYDAALPYILDAKKEAEALKIEDIFQNVYRGLSYYYAGTGNIPLAIAYIDSLVAYRDTIYNKEKAAYLLESETRLRTQEKEAQIVRQELELEHQANLRNAILLGSMIAILGLLFFLFYIRNRQKLKQQQAELALQLERKEAEQLRKLDQLKSNFFANISHEFRTPLTLILGPLGQMRKGIFEGNQQQYFDIMYRNGRRLQDLINQLLDLSKLENSKMQMNELPGDIYKYIRQVAGSLESWADRKKINYELTIPKAQLWVYFDRDKLEKIVVNLLSNAIKFTNPEGKVTLSIDSKDVDDQEIIGLSIMDTGVGIPADELDKVFERFYQSTYQVDGMASSGIGLALTKELVTFHGGKIKVTSEQGKGTTFYVEIPYKKASSLEQTEAEPDRLMPNLSAALDSTPLAIDKTVPIILIVEDNEDVRTYIKDQLVGDYQLLEAENGKIGLDKALSTIPDLIVSDIMMPELDGLELTKRLKKDEKTSHIPVIMLTAKAELRDKLEGLETGADDYLVKPFDAEELRIRAHNLIEQRQKLRERFTKESLFFPKETAITSVDEKYLRRLMEVIELNMDNEAFSIEDFGRQVGMSRSQLHRKIKALTDKSPSIFLRTARLHRAKQLLKAQAGNSTEVAFMVGFSNTAYFSKCFKEEFGVTPTEVLSAKKVN